MSRAYKARRKAKRQQARAAAKPEPPARRTWPRRSVALVPVLVIVAILAVVGAVGFGAGSGISEKQVGQEVTELLAGIPQDGPTLGAPDAPITIQIFADLECPTVKRFVVVYLPSIVHKWVRGGDVKLEYRSLETDTGDERMFFQQETAALAAGRQDRMWNFVLTFIHEQEEASTNYATEKFLTDIASQVQGLKRARWRHDRENPSLSEQVALNVYGAHAKGFSFTPSFLIDLSDGKGGHVESSDASNVRREVRASLAKAVEALGKEASEEALKDVPGLGFLGSA